MAIKFTDLTEYLNKYVSLSHVYNDCGISSVRCLKKDENWPKECVIIGYVSELPESSNGSIGQNLLLIEDKKMPTFYHGEASINWLTLKPDQIELTELINLVEDFLKNEIILSTYTQEILSCLSEQQDLQKLLDITYKFIGNPLRLIDAAHNIIASSLGDGQLDEPQWVDYETNKNFSQDYNNICNSDYAFRHHMLNSPEPYVMNYPSIFKHRQRTARVRQNEMNIAFVSELEYYKPFSKFGAEILKIFSKFACIKLSNDAHFFSSYDSPASDLLMYVLKEERPNPLTTQQLISNAGLTLRKNLYLIYITDGDKFDSKAKMIYIRNILDKFFVGYLTEIVNSKVIILLDSDIFGKFPVSLRRMTDLEQLLRVNNVFAGISWCYHDIINSSKALAQAQKAVYFAIQSKINDTIFYYEDYILNNLVQTFLTKEPANNIIDPMLYELLDHDRTHNSELTATLYFFIKNNLDMHLTSEILHIHSNTLKYRMQKIVNLTGLDIKNIDIFLRLRLSFIALHHEFPQLVEADWISELLKSTMF